jgi:DNA polymerase
MRDLLRDLRRILEHEAALYGPQLPLDEGGGANTTADAPSTAAPAHDDEPPASSADASPDAADASAEAPERSPTPTASPKTDDAPSPTSADDADDDMPNKDLFGNRTRPPEEDPTLPPWERINALVPDDAPYRDAESLEAVEEYLANTVLVPIDEDRENPVFGVGDPQADLVIIGEAPGRDEDKEGEPFVGRAGQLLDKILDAINFQREDVYITNILKSRPPRNRDPHADEVEAHLPILYKQLALIRPKIILAVGKVAGNTLLDRSSSLSNLRDQEHDFYGIPLMVTYHPAALLRNSNWKRPTWEDVKLLRTRYDELTAEDD